VTWHAVEYADLRIRFTTVWDVLYECDKAYCAVVHVLKRTYFMAVIDGMFCLDARDIQTTNAISCQSWVEREYQIGWCRMWWIACTW